MSDTLSVKNEAEEAAMKQHAKQLIQSCEDYLQQCDETQQTRADTKPPLIQRFLLRIKNIIKG